MAFWMLCVAGVLEVVWAFAMKASNGFTRPGPTIVALAAMLLSLGLLAASLRSLPLGLAYTVWTGIGAVGAFAVGVLVLDEPANATRLLAAALIVSGMLLMKLSSPN